MRTRKAPNIYPTWFTSWWHVYTHLRFVSIGKCSGHFVHGSLHLYLLGSYIILQTEILRGDRIMHSPGHQGSPKETEVMDPWDRYRMIQFILLYFLSNKLRYIFKSIEYHIRKLKKINIRLFKTILKNNNNNSSLQVCNIYFAPQFLK